MDKSTAPFEGFAIPLWRKRRQRSCRPKQESQAVPAGRGQSSLCSEQLSDTTSKVIGDENAGSSKRKGFNLNQCASRGSSGTQVGSECSHNNLKGDDALSTSYINGGLKVNNEMGGGFNQKLHNGGVAPSRQQGLVGDGVATNIKIKKVKLTVGGVTRTFEPKPTSHATSGSGFSTNSAKISDAPRPQPKLINQDSDKYSSPQGKNRGLQGIPWKEFSKGGFNPEEISTGKMYDKVVSRKRAEKSDRVRKNKRVLKKRDLNEQFNDDDDDEVRYSEKLRTFKAAGGYKGAVEESDIKHRSLSEVLKVGNNENSKDFGPSRSDKDSKKTKSKRVWEDTYDEKVDELMSEGKPQGKKKKLGKDITNSPTKNTKETALTMRQRALLYGKSSSSVAGSNGVEFPNGLPPPPPRRQKEKLTEVEQQQKKAEAAERRRLQKEKAARELEAEAIRKILGQDSSRKKQEDKIKKHQEELAQERAVSAQMLPPNTIRCVMGPTGTTVTFSEDVGLPHIFNAKPCSYPPPREKCAGPSCSNPYRYRDSKTKVPLCSLQCYKAIHEKMQGGDTSC